ncbi:MAG: radical SAM protein, partial [Oricola sp.]
MEVIAAADKAAFSGSAEQGVERANGLIALSGLRGHEARARGRASVINPSGRFETYSRAVFDDGWNSFEDLPPFKTEVQTEHARTIITKNTSPDISFDRSINPYRGCEHGCVYCFAR